MILLIDNYDSFSYNLYQLVGSLNPDIWVVRNDELSVEEIRRLSPSHLILSPGPGRPAEAGVCEAAVRELAGSIPLLFIVIRFDFMEFKLKSKYSVLRRASHAWKAVPVDPVHGLSSFPRSPRSHSSRPISFSLRRGGASA